MGNTLTKNGFAMPEPLLGTHQLDGKLLEIGGCVAKNQGGMRWGSVRTQKRTWQRDHLWSMLVVIKHEMRTDS